jgi:hypothetical protein
MITLYTIPYTYFTDFHMQKNPICVYVYTIINFKVFGGGP